MLQLLVRCSSSELSQGWSINIVNIENQHLTSLTSDSSKEDSIGPQYAPLHPTLQSPPPPAPSAPLQVWTSQTCRPTGSYTPARTYAHTIWVAAPPLIIYSSTAAHSILQHSEDHNYNLVKHFHRCLVSLVSFAYVNLEVRVSIICVFYISEFCNFRDEDLCLLVVCSNLILTKLYIENYLINSFDLNYRTD